MRSMPRRDFLALSLSACGGLTCRAGEPGPADVHRQILELAARQQERRRTRFAAIRSKADLDRLQKDLRQAFLTLLDGLPTSSEPPAVKRTGQVEGDGYLIDKLVFESLPGYF